VIFPLLLLTTDSLKSMAPIPVSRPQSIHVPAPPRPIKLDLFGNIPVKETKKAPTIKREPKTRLTVTGKPYHAPRRISADMDAPDLFLVQMKNSGVGNKIICEMLKNKWGVEYDRKTVSTRYLRLLDAVRKAEHMPKKESWTKEEVRDLIAQLDEC